VSDTGTCRFAEGRVAFGVRLAAQPKMLRGPRDSVIARGSARSRSARGRARQACSLPAERCASDYLMRWLGRRPRRGPSLPTPCGYLVCTFVQLVQSEETAPMTAGWPPGTKPGAAASPPAGRTRAARAIGTSKRGFEKRPAAARFWNTVTPSVRDREKGEGSPLCTRTRVGVEGGSTAAKRGLTHYEVSHRS